ncbi:MAG: hypothetical protein Tsb0015_06880 [Simkaniaceae bacterium]
MVNQRSKQSLPTPQTVSWLGDWCWGSQEQEEQWVRPNTYDEIIQMLEDLESGELERRYSPMQLEKVNDYIATLAKEGILPNEFEEECEIEEDTYDLMYGEDSAFQLTRYLENSHEYMIIPAVLGGYSGYDIIQCGKISKAWKKTKKFCKKHKKAIIIGAVVVVAVAAVTVAVVVASSAAATSAASAAAAGAAGTASSGSGSSRSESSGNSSSTPSGSQPQTSANDIPIFKSAMDEQISSFKENLAHENFFQTNTAGQGLSLEETGRAIGPLFAHDSFNQFNNHLSNYPQFSQEVQSIASQYNFSMPPGASDNPVGFGHNEIDSRFASNSGPMFSDPAKEVNFNALSYQVRGEKAMDFGYYNQALSDFGKSIDMNPMNSAPYLDRSEANFRLGNYDKCVEDFHVYTEKISQEPKKYPMNIPDFTFGFVKGVPKGILESGNNILLLCSDVVLHPIQTGEQMWASLKMLSDLARSNEWGIFAEVLAPEVHHLITQWDTIPCDVRGELAGHAFGKYGADIIIPGALAKAAARGMRGAQELGAVSNSLKTAKRTFLMESVAGMKNGAKIAEVVQLEQRISGWLGEGARFIRNEAGDSVFLSKDGLRRVRFDFKNPSPHHNPHAHVEVKVNNKWVKSGPIYPTDVPHN